MEEIKKTGESCPKSGRWIQRETGEINYYEKGDMFGGYHEIVKENENGTPIYSDATKSAHYVYVD